MPNILLRRAAVLILILSMVTPIAAVAAKKSLEAISDSPRPELAYKEAGIWLREHTEENALMMSRKSWIAFYSKHKCLALPWASAEEIFAYARFHGVNYIVIDDHIAAMPQLEYLLEGNNTPDFLHQVYQNNDNGTKLVVFRTNF